MFFSLLAVVLALWLCYITSRYLAKKVNNSGNTNNMKIIERVALSQDKCLVIAKICGKLYLLSVSNNIEILKELDEADLNTQPQVSMSSFKAMLNGAIKHRSNQETGENSDET